MRRDKEEIDSLDKGKYSYAVCLDDQICYSFSGNSSIKYILLQCLNAKKLLPAQTIITCAIGHNCQSVCKERRKKVCIIQYYWRKVVHALRNLIAL